MGRMPLRLGGLGQWSWSVVLVSGLGQWSWGGCGRAARALRSAGNDKDPAMTAPLVIDVVSDVVCPWCFIGKRRLEQAIALRPRHSGRNSLAPLLPQ